MIINKAHLCTRMEVWTPKYDTTSLVGNYEEPVALLHKGKVEFATPTIIVEFPRAKHLQGQRFAIKKAYAQKHIVGTNGKAAMYEIPMSHFESWTSGKEVLDEIADDWPEDTSQPN